MAGLLCGSVACEKQVNRVAAGEESASASSVSVAESMRQELEDLRVRYDRLELENRTLMARSGSQGREKGTEVQELRKQVAELQTSLKANEEMHRQYLEQHKTAMTKVVTGLRFENVLAGGKMLKGAVITSVDSEGVKLTHDGGISRVAFQDLPSDFQFLLGRGTVTNDKAVASQSTSATASVLPDVASPAGSTLFEPESLLIIKTDLGTGSGFIVKTEGKYYAYTNAHVLCGSPGGFNSKLVSVTTANGTALPMPYLVEVSDTYNEAAPHGLEDVARFEVVPPKGVRVYELVAEGAGALSPNAEVVAYGNSLGGGAITELKGTCLAVGPDRVEISCEIVPGNSGGPVVETSSRKVVGISTYLDSGGLRNVWAKSTQFGRVRRFAVRPERVAKWRRMELPALYASIEEFRNFDRDTLTLAAACFLSPRGDRGGFVAPSDRRGDYIVRDIVIDGAKHRLGGIISGGISKVNERLGGAGTTLSASAAAPVYGEFYSSVTSGSASQVSSLKSVDRSPYMKQFVKELVAVREYWQEQFQKSAQSFARSLR